MIVFWGIATGMAGVGVWWWNLPFWPLLAVSALAMLINGGIASIEDEAPSGFNNPRRIETRPTENRQWLITRGFYFLLAIIGLLAVPALVVWLFD